jgi:hypothetical protein
MCVRHLGWLVRRRDIAIEVVLFGRVQKIICWGELVTISPEVSCSAAKGAAERYAEKVQIL